MKKCYIHDFEHHDPKRKFDARKHHICLDCGCKLWMIGKKAKIFEINDKSGFELKSYSNGA